MRSAAVVLLIVSGLRAASAQETTLEMPPYDYRTYCTDVAARSGGNQNWSRHVCVEKEEAAIGELRRTWPTLAPEIKNTCDHFARQAGESFFILDTCVMSYIEDNIAKGRPERNTVKVYRF